jgi:hypothetical protein
MIVALAWLTIVLGLALSVGGLAATRYFRRQVTLMGGNWILMAFYRTTATITAVAMWLTLARAIVLATGPQVWITVISGLAVCWLLVIPLLLRREFREHEGR